MLLPWQWIWQKTSSKWRWPDRSWKIIERSRLTRTQFERWFDNRESSAVVMEACGSAHHFALKLGRLHERHMRIEDEYGRLKRHNV